MELTLPIYVQAVKVAGKRSYRCRPVFLRELSVDHVDLRVAMQQLGRKLKEQLDLLGRRHRHEELAEAAFCPYLTSRTFKFQFPLRERYAKLRVLAITFEALGRTLGNVPSVSSQWYEVEAGESLELRTQEIVREQLLEAERKRGSAFDPGEYSLAGDAWVTDVEIDVAVDPPTQEELEQQFASLFGNGPMSGGAELRRVGHCLDALYPDALERCALREPLVNELLDLLNRRDRRPLLIVGPRQVGKTALIHECVYRRVAARSRPSATRRNVWHLSPQRLISGMSYVGQWEERLLAILREARQRQHVLYFDDLLGLFRAGQSRDSSLCVADVLKTWLPRREVRLLGELTPEAWHALNERDRAFADQFHVVRVPETSAQQTVEILLDVQRRLEFAHRCRFDLNVIPATIELQRRWNRAARFPGKAATFLAHLAVRHVGETVPAEQVIEEFQAQTGLSLRLLTGAQTRRSETLEGLGERIVGQWPALEACADVVATAQASLNDPHRPLASLVFLGPTGVGKTETAKALAELLFSSSDRLVRFDMNEYVSSLSASRLAGSVDHPDGLLTSEIRRQPYCVILLDEIEKAHPDVLDVLLQVIGEARLTDAFGRTADFSNAVVIMTSNLGVQEASSRIGFSPDTGAEGFLKAAERFFRPEFLNRIDRIIPFQPLGRDEVRQVAEQQMRNVVQREGIVRRRCILRVSQAAMDRVVEEGFHPLLGARALKRAIRTGFTEPVSLELAQIDPSVPTLIDVDLHDGQYRVLVEPFPYAQPFKPQAYGSPPELASSLEAYYRATGEQLTAGRPDSTGGADGFTPETLHYFALQEQRARLREALAALTERLEAQREAKRPPMLPPKVRPGEPVPKSLGKLPPPRNTLREKSAADDVLQYLEDVTAGAPSDLPQLPDRALREASLLSLMLAAGPADQQFVLAARLLSQHHPSPASPGSNASRRGSEFFAPWSACVANLLEHELDFECELLDSDLSANRLLLRVAGPCLLPILQLECGIHMYCGEHGQLIPAELNAIRWPDTGAPLPQLWEQVMHSANRLVAPPHRRILRLYHADLRYVDLRTQTRGQLSSAAHYRDLVAACCPPPQLPAPNALP